MQLIRRFVPPTDQLFVRIRTFFLLIPLLSAALFSVPLLVLAYPKTGATSIIAGVLIPLLAAWWIWGYRRGSFPSTGLIFEGLALVVVGIATSDPRNTLGLFYCSLFFRSLYGSPRQASILVLVYLATFLSVVTQIHGPTALSLFSPLVLANIPGFLLTTCLMQLLAQLLHQHDRTVARERILRRGGMALTVAQDRTSVQAAAVTTAVELTAEVRGVRISLARGTAEQLIVVAVAGDHATDIIDGRITLQLRLDDPSTLLTENNLIELDPQDPDVRQALSFSPKTGCLLVVPLFIRNTFHGALTVESDGTMLPDCKDGLQALGSQVALVLESVALMEELRRDITERKELEAQLVHQAWHDALTNLPNRALFIDRLDHALARTARDMTTVGIIFLDLDNFKLINDNFGHHSGDEVLVEVATRLPSCVRPHDTVARFAGDEFTILLEHIVDSRDAMRVVERILTQMNKPMRLREQVVSMTASIGLVLSTPDHMNADDLLRAADSAMYQVKTTTKGTYKIFDHAQRGGAGPDTVPPVA